VLNPTSTFCRVLFEIVVPMVAAAVAAIWFAMRPSAARLRCRRDRDGRLLRRGPGSWIALPPETAAAEKSFGIRTTAW
jgi:hypothetical protein